jgi:hypothetical protein
MIRSAFRNAILRNTTTFTKIAVHNAGHYHKSILPQNSMFLLTRAFTIQASRMQSSDATISGKESDVIHQIPEDLFYLHHPKPVRHEIIESKAPLDSKALENIDIKSELHRKPVTWSDKIAFYTVKILRVPTDLFFKKKYIHRAVMLETVSRLEWTNLLQKILLMT